MSDLISTESGCRAHGLFEAAALDGRFPLPGDKPHYARDRVVDIKHVRLDFALDLKSARVEGSVAHTFAPINDGIASFDLDAVGLEIRRVTLGGERDLGYSLADGRLRIDLDTPRNAGEELTVVVEYSGTDPKRGLYFIRPDEGYPHKRLEAWTQGEDEDSRFWFPCYDFPNEMATSEMHVTVAPPNTVIAVGEMMGIDQNADGTRTFHWRQNVPHAAYLTSVVAGEYAELRDEWDGIPVTYYVPPGREEDGREAFKLTPEMMRLFSEKTGVRYPYAKYAQVVVQDFIFGGMENVSATTMTDALLADARARGDQDYEYLVAHELAHQWFGDLLTCRDWSHGWLNEGFATFFELVWHEHHRGLDWYRMALQQEVDSYMREAGGSYRRAIVTNVYNAPMDLFDRHLYEKGGIVLNMLRRELGDDLYWKAIRRYVITQRSTNVTTPDLQRAIEAATGRNLDWFFDQWVYGAGHPDLKAEYAWDEANNTAKISLKQTQEGDNVAKVFRLPLTIDFTPDAGERQSFKVEMNDREQAFYFPLVARPRMARIDPGMHVLKAIDFQRSGEMLREQLANDDDVLGRIDAARALGKKGDADAIAALGKAVRGDAFWGVQSEAARALGSIRSSAALDELLASMSIPEGRSRRSVMSALGEFRDERAAEALDRVLRDGDASYYVEANAAAAIGKTRSPRALGALELAMSKDSHNEVIRSTAMGGFAETHDAAALPIVMDWTSYGRPQQVRMAAASSLGKLADFVSDAQKSDIVDRLIEMLSDPWYRCQTAAIDALKDIKDPKALPHLQRIADRELDGRVVRMA
ncbi:MAG TPA: M1 family aminopeptidase, partial [Dehalococcoidia bacterium]